MSIFQEMQQLHSDWQERRVNAYRDAVRFTHAFRRAFHSYLGAPEDFENFDPREGTCPYVTLVKVDPLNENEQYRMSDLDPGYHYDAHISEEEGDGLVFGVKLVIDNDVHTWPKTPFWFRLSMKPRVGRCEVKVFQDAYVVDYENEQTWRPLFQDMVASVRSTLDQLPGDTFRETARSIGFLDPGLKNAESKSESADEAI